MTKRVPWAIQGNTLEGKEKYGNEFQGVGEKFEQISRCNIRNANYEKDYTFFISEILLIRKKGFIAIVGCQFLRPTLEMLRPGVRTVGPSCAS